MKYRFVSSMVFIGLLAAVFSCKSMRKLNKKEQSFKGKTVFESRVIIDENVFDNSIDLLAKKVDSPRWRSS